MGLSHFSHFKRTSRYVKIQKVTGEYHQRYLLMLTRMPYKYHHPTSLTIELPKAFIGNLLRVPISSGCSQEHLLAVDYLMTLALVANESKRVQAKALM